MAEIAVTVVTDRLLSLLADEARLLRSVHTKVEHIKKELLSIQDFLKYADAKAEKGDTSQGVKTWVQELRETAYCIEDLVDEYTLHFANRPHRRGVVGFLCKISHLLPKLKPRHEIASKVQDLKLKVDKLKETGSSFGFFSSLALGSGGSSGTSVPWHDPGVTALFIEEAEINGIESPKGELIEWLVEGVPERTVISVVGMGGLGKTTLAKKVYDNKKVVEHFDCHAWIIVSQLLGRHLFVWPWSAVPLSCARRGHHSRNGPNQRREKILLENLGSLETIKESLIRVIDSLDEEKAGIVIEKSEEVVSDEELRPSIEAIKAVSMLASMAESKVSEYQEMRKKEKRELENSVVSLTEENRDINSLLRIALVEKDVVEKSLNRLKGNNEQKRVALLQIAERGLQKVGFGFMMGSAPNEVPVENLGSNAGSKSDSSECEEEVVSLASTVERIMKNLRQEITQLRRSLEESRSDTERLQSLTEKQAQKIAENTLYIKELEDREMVLAQNVEELLLEMKETEEEVARWREACELEVEAGKNVVEERDKVTLILKQELEKTKAALDISNGKLKLKEDLAAAAMAAQAAAERSLQLADSRAAELRERIEELTRQLEEAESRDRNRLRVRHVCWPWRALKVNPASNTNTRVGNVRRMLPEMQALLH